MTPPPLPYVGRILVALAFFAFVVWAIGGHALPWAIARLPLAFPIALFLGVAFLAIAWATADVLRGREHGAD